MRVSGVTTKNRKKFDYDIKTDKLSPYPVVSIYDDEVIISFVSPLEVLDDTADKREKPRIETTMTGREAEAIAGQFVHAVLALVEREY